MNVADLKLDAPEFSELRLLNFSISNVVGDITFSINAHKVREVIEYRNPTPLPEAYHPYIGILNLRGVPVPILDLGPLFEENCGSVLDGDNSSCRIIICETMHKQVGIVVEKSMGITEHKDGDLTHSQFATKKNQSRFVNGIVSSPGSDKYSYVLDLEAILEEITPEEEIKKAKGHKRFMNKRVLIVEDSQTFRKKLTRFFEALGMSVLTAEDGIAGLEVLESKGPFDIMFSDIEMPRLNGIEMVRAIRKDGQWHDLPIYFHSSISNPNLIEQIESEGLGDYIVKFDEDVIMAKLEEAL